jgi:hypothetical protein
MKSLSSRGISHVLVPLLVFVMLGAIGGAYFIRQSHAATTDVTSAATAAAATNPCPSNNAWKTIHDQNGVPMGLNDDDYGGGHQCANNSDGGPDFSVSNAGSVVASSGKVQAYPNIIFGCSNTHCYSSGWPKKVQGVPQWFASGHITTGAVSGSSWDAGYDLWFNRSDSIGPSRGTEIFINFDRGGRAEPTTNYKETVTLGGAQYDVFEHPQTATISGTTYTWNYVQFWRLYPTDTISHIQLNPFMQKAIDGGWLQFGWYWTGIDGGFELWHAGSGLHWTYNYITTS